MSIPDPGTGPTSDESTRSVDPKTLKTRMWGRRLILDFYAAVRVARFHTMANNAVQSAIGKLAETCAALFELHDSISILFYSRDFYVNDARIKATREDYDLFESFASDLQKREIGRIHLSRQPTPAEAAEFIVAFNSVSPQNSKRPYEELGRRLQAAGVRGVSVSKFVGGDKVQSLPSLDQGTLARQSYFRAVTVAQQLYTQAREGKPLALKNAKRIVQSFVDLLDSNDSENSDLLLLLTGVKNWQGYLFNHAVNTCVLSLALGHAMGLNRDSLRALGIAAVLADVGNTMLPEEVLDSPEPLSEAQWDLIRTHPVRGVAAISAHQEQDRTLMRATTACLWHHRDFDGSGYPSGMQGRPGLFAQIIGVCDRYDAMTTPRPYRPRPMTPPRALESLARGAGKAFNPLVLRAFVQHMGTVPAGTVVLLTTGEIGLVMRSRSQLRKGDQTRIRVLMRGSGSLPENEVVTLEDSNLERHVMQVIGADDEALHSLRANVIMGDATNP
ncbi:MAG: HD-GYP domain-containing protein (c-di-GMP phosphodiesterase class II) [Myxococcota bacterium]|jgi:HD-GYP domain-containing protein (c-di-GMP phosphodiesterase class II)